MSDEHGAAAAAGPGRTGRLVAVDWGTSSCRAWLLAGLDTVLDARSSADGVQVLYERARAAHRPSADVFDAAFEDLVGPWLEAAPSVPAIACGMVGSDRGWVDAGYRTVPADLGRPPRRALLRTSGGSRLAVLPGLRLDGEVPDLMRGEETQVAGLLDGRHRPDGVRVIVLPGTHSKWVRVRGTTVVDFTTFLSGEMFGLLARHSILAPPTGSEAPPRWPVFDAAVRLALSERGTAGLLGTAFSARALVVEGRMDVADVPDHLSGLVVGHELRGALATPGWTGRSPVTVCGQPQLAERYRRAFALAGVPAAVAPDGAARRGLWRSAVALGLVRQEEVVDV